MGGGVLGSQRLFVGFCRLLDCERAQPEGAANGQSAFAAWPAAVWEQSVHAKSTLLTSPTFH